MSYLKPGVAEQLLVAEVEHHVLRLRELLVRGDENWKAWQLLQAVPYWARTPALEQAIEDQRQMVLHAIEPEAYAAYYGSNPHDRPMEEQYPGVTVDNACEVFPRLAMALDWLRRMNSTRVEVIDLSGNDGLMAAALKLRLGDKLGVEIIDLDPRCVERAKGRGLGARYGNFMDEHLKPLPGWEYDVAILFETIEHLPDPGAGLKAALEYAPTLYLSTPSGAVEGLDLPTWAHVERKGHLWAILGSDIQRWADEAGARIRDSIMGPDGVMVFRITRQ